MKAYLPILATVLLLGCSNHETVVINDVRAKVDSAKLEKVLASQDKDMQERGGFLTEADLCQIQNICTQY